MPTLTVKKMWKHLRTVQTHRKWVRHYCFLSGIPWQGITHDLSKYSPAEFFESARYWSGTFSPIDAAKEDKGISLAWLHHRGRNKHHYLYWYDNIEEGGYCHVMPKKYFIELVCDFLGAARTYLKKDFSFQKEKEWWEKKREKVKLNDKHIIMLDIIFSDLAYCERRAYIDVLTPEKLLKTGYIGMIWEANCGNTDLY